MRYSPEIVRLTEEWIAENGLHEYGGAKLKELVEYLGIEHKSYYNWLNNHPEYKEAIERGKLRFKESLSKDLIISLARAAKGYEAEEMQTIYKPNPANPKEPTIKEMRKIKKHYPPNVAAAIFLLTNLDPEHYKNRIRNDIDVKPPKKEETQKTIEEIDAEIARLSKLNQ